jgi:exopolysaccharide production protein ExoY
VTAIVPIAECDLVVQSHSLQPFYISLRLRDGHTRYDDCDAMYPDALLSPETTPTPDGIAPHLELTERSLWRAIAFAERFACIVALLVLSPVCLTVAIAIAILSGESPLIAVLRSGRFGKALWLLKFRTMWSGCRGFRSPFRPVEYVIDEDGPTRKESSDFRVTSGFARFCRRFSLDEIPQLVNVIAGEMSLVAPRPLTSSELSEHYGEDAAEVVSVRPGITGLWQVSGRNSLSYAERRRLDVLLIRTLTPKLYLRILVRTIPVVLAGKNSW